jgi:hypothetical protein
VALAVEILAQYLMGFLGALVGVAAQLVLEVILLVQVDLEPQDKEMRAALEIALPTLAVVAAVAQALLVVMVEQMVVMVEQGCLLPFQAHQ